MKRHKLHTKESAYEVKQKQLDYWKDEKREDNTNIFSKSTKYTPLTAELKHKASKSPQLNTWQKNIYEILRDLSSPEHEWNNQVGLCL